MKRLLTLAIILSIFSCEPRQGKSVEELPSNESKLHPVVVTDVIQAKNYTYVQATDNGREIWMAILKGEFEIGKTYYYDRAMEMKNFKSKDLDRTFETVYFLEGLYDDPKAFTKSGVMAPSDNVHAGTANMSEIRQEINIPQEAGVTLIGDLHVNKKDLASTKVTVKGIVTKYNPNIMDKNWVHVQDGSGDLSTYDLTITTQDEVNVGSIVKFEGKVVINKDFGHGYKYDLLLEDAVQLDKKADIKVN
jgi:hypothetical protein